MENLKRQKVKGTILLEAVLALAVFAMIASLFIGQISHSRKKEAEILQREESLRLAKMALQTELDQLSLNGKTVRLEKSSERIRIYQGGELMIDVQKN